MVLTSAGAEGLEPLDDLHRRVLKLASKEGSAALLMAVQALVLLERRRGSCFHDIGAREALKAVVAILKESKEETDGDSRGQ